MAFEDEADVLYKFEYHLQDHLGNTRVVFGGHSNGKAELVQQTDYYPFGLVMAQREYLSYDDFPENQVLANKYLYNGKEWQDEEIGGVKLDWYDYGARMYDPQLGRWHTIDPTLGLTLSVTPYHYCLNNPIAYFDPTGMYTVYDLSGNPHEIGDSDVKDGYLDADHKNDNSQSNGIVIDLWSGTKSAWDKFWGIGARKDLKNARTSEEMTSANSWINVSNAAIVDATETINTVNEVLIISAGTMIGVGIAAEGGGFLISRLYAVSSDLAQQSIVKGGFSDVDIANSLIAGLGGKKAVSELAKTLIDWQPGDQLPTLKTNLIDIGIEYSLRLTLNKVLSGGSGDLGLEFGVQLLKKAVRDQVQDPIINTIKSTPAPSLYPTTKF